VVVWFGIRCLVWCGPSSHSTAWVQNVILGSDQCILSFMFVSCRCLGLAVAVGWDRPFVVNKWAFPFGWCLWMNICSYGRSRVVYFVGWSSVIVSLIVPYSSMFCRICSAYADWGFFYVACVFANVGVRHLEVCPIYDFCYVLHVSYNFCLTT
jgi:hypothetical protein